MSFVKIMFHPPELRSPLVIFSQCENAFTYSISKLQVRLVLITLYLSILSACDFNKRITQK